MYKRQARTSAFVEATACRRGRLSPPLDYMHTTSKFGPRNPRFHEGLDLRAPNGTPVRAMADGIVELKVQMKNGKLVGFGRYIVIRHGKKGSTLSAHLLSTSVAERQKVKAGDVIGLSDTSGAEEPHLHIEYAPDGKIYTDSSKVDPEPCIIESPFVYIIQEKVHISDEAGPVGEYCYPRSGGSIVCGNKIQEFLIEQVVEGQLKVVGQSGILLYKQLKKVVIHDNSGVNEVSFDGVVAPNGTWTRQADEDDPIRFTIKKRGPINELTVETTTLEGKTQSLNLVGWSGYATKAEHFNSIPVPTLHTPWNFPIVGTCYAYAVRMFHNAYLAYGLGWNMLEWKVAGRIVDPPYPQTIHISTGSITGYKFNVNGVSEACYAEMVTEGMHVLNGVSALHYVVQNLVPVIPEPLSRPNIAARIRRVYSEKELAHMQRLRAIPIEYEVVLD